MIIYAGSLVNPALLNYKKESCAVYDSASMTLEQVIEVMKDTEARGGMTVRLHTGDPPSTAPSGSRWTSWTSWASATT